MTQSSSPLNAHQCYTHGMILLNNGHYLGAQLWLEKAYMKEPHNSLYAKAKELLHLRTLAFFSRDPEEKFDLFSNSADCAANGCECCCEACGNGCCEACAENCCDGCDCG